MSWWRRLRGRIQRLLYLPAEADDEIRFHLAEATWPGTGLDGEDVLRSAR
jgi:hypothetical protein